jgi:hypothetical protein
MQIHFGLTGCRMREQSIFFEHQIGDKRIVVLKSYDARLAREAFDEMAPEALKALGASLELESKFDVADIPSPSDDQFAEFLWEAVEDGAREDWDSFSYFIVNEECSGRTSSLFVSSDWPSAEAFAKKSLTAPA